MVTEIIEETTVTEVPVTTTVVSVDTNNVSTNITESTESPALNTTAATTITANINTTVATLSASTTAGLSSTTKLSSEVTPPSVTNAENVTEKIESIFDENNNTLNTTQLTIGDGITQKTEDGDAIVLQKFAVEEVRVKNFLVPFSFFKRFFFVFSKAMHDVHSFWCSFDTLKKVAIFMTKCSRFRSNKMIWTP